jgi:plastocyanin
MRGAVALLALAAVPAFSADDQTIAAQDTFYDPPSVTIDVGDTLTLDNIGGTHNFHFSDGSQLPAVPATDSDPAWSPPPTKTFNTAGAYSFFCDFHGPSMSGTVKVVDPNATPSPSPTPSATPTPPPQQTEPAAVVVRRLRLRGAAFCSRRSDTCRRPGVALRIDVSAPARVRGTLKRKRRAAGRIDLGTVPAGARTLRFGKRLKAGRYTLRLRVGTLPARTLRFRIRP